MEIHRKYLQGVVLVAGMFLLWVLPASRVPADPLAIKPIRVVQPNIGQQDKWRPGFSEEAARRLAALTTEAGRRSPALVVLARGGGHRSARRCPDRRTRRLRPVRTQARGGIRRTRRISFDRRDRSQRQGWAACRWRRQQHLRAWPGRESGCSLRQGAPRPLRRISPVAAFAVLDRPVSARARRPRLRAGARPSHRLSRPAGGRSGCSSATRSSFRAMSSTGPTAPTSSSTPRTMPGSEAGARRSISPRPSCAPRRKGFPCIRSTPTGISAIIDARGMVVKSLPWRTAGVIDGVLPPPAVVPTPFARFGNLIPLLLALAMIIAAVAHGPIALGGTRRYRHGT